MKDDKFICLQDKLTDIGPDVFEGFKAEYIIFGDGTKVLTRFYATSDGEGKITGTYRAASSEGAAFNGFTIVGGFPKYVPNGAVVVFR
jgi:hypothetical protein